MMRRAALRYLLAAIVMLVVRPALAETNIVIHIYPGSLISLYPQVGIDQGFYKAEGLSATLLPMASGPEANAALAGGSLNFVLNTSDNLILARSRGLPVMAVVGNQVRNFYSLVARKDIDLPQKASAQQVATALAGKKVGINATGTNGERFTRAIFAAGSVPASQVNLVTVGAPPSALAAFAAKSIDGAFSWEPFQTVTTMTGSGKIVLDCRVDGECPPALEEPGKAFQTYYTSKTFLDAHPDAVAAFARAHHKIDAWVHDPKNRPVLLELVKRLLPPPSGMTIDADAYASSVLDHSLPAFGTTIDPEGLAAWNKQLVDAKLIPAAVNVSDLVWSGALK
jgi:NitT/TauT family transport system substrate-binding protein